MEVLVKLFRKEIKAVCMRQVIEFTELLERKVYENPPSCNRYFPHQGAKEIARRAAQTAKLKGKIK